MPAKNLNHNSCLTPSEKVKMFGACKLLSLGINVWIEKWQHEIYHELHVFITLSGLIFREFHVSWPFPQNIFSMKCHKISHPQNLILPKYLWNSNARYYIRQKNQGKHLKNRNRWQKSDNDISEFLCAFSLNTMRKQSSKRFFFIRLRLTRKHALRHIFGYFVFTKYIPDKIVKD